MCAWPSRSLVAIPGNVEAGANRGSRSGEMGLQACTMNLQSSELERGWRKGTKGTTGWRAAQAQKFSDPPPVNPLITTPELTTKINFPQKLLGGIVGRVTGNSRRQTRPVPVEQFQSPLSLELPRYTLFPPPAGLLPGPLCATGSRTKHPIACIDTRLFAGSADGYFTLQGHRLSETRRSRWHEAGTRSL